MTIYKCEKCNYETTNKNHFTDHQNRKKPCDSVNPHKSIKNNKSDHCEICDMPFSRSDSLERHCKKFHPELVQKNKQKNIQTITGNKNIQINNNPQINGNNNNININTPIIIQPIIHIHPYEYNNINDLTLFEQYISLISSDTPHNALLDNLI